MSSDDEENNIFDDAASDDEDDWEEVDVHQQQQQLPPTESVAPRSHKAIEITLQPAKSKDDTDKSAHVPSSLSQCSDWALERRASLMQSVCCE
jgi:hypothetical protein